MKKKSCIVIGLIMMFISSSITTPCIGQTMPLDIGKTFFYSGWMGCISAIEMKSNWLDEKRPDSTCYQIVFTSPDGCDDKWSGVYWVNTRTKNGGANRGQEPGRNLSKKGYTKITFYARGEKGGEVVEFGSGGIDARYGSDCVNCRYRDSYGKVHTADGYNIVLTKEWKLYTIDLKGANLLSVIGGFYWSASWNENRDGATFYIDDIQFE